MNHDPSSRATRHAPRATLTRMRDIIQEDVGGRGLRNDPEANLLTACPNDFAEACRSLAETAAPAVGIVTGFYIAHGQPPCGETDGPLGAIFLARALVPLGFKVVLATDAFCRQALEVGLALSGLRKAVPLITLPPPTADLSPADYRQFFADRSGPLTHLIAIERVGPSHTPESLRAQPGAADALMEQFLKEVPAEHHDRCHNMRGLDITWHMSAAHHLFEGRGARGEGREEEGEKGRRGEGEKEIRASRERERPEEDDPNSKLKTQNSKLITIAIGDGGNEIGMGKVPWDVLRRNIPRGGLIACRTPADYLIVSGVSNWGAYGLAAGVRLLKSAPADSELFDLQRERDLLEAMVERGPLVDGPTGEQDVRVDGLDFERYAAPLRRLGELDAEPRA